MKAVKIIKFILCCSLLVWLISIQLNMISINRQLKKQQFPLRYMRGYCDSLLVEQTKFIEQLAAAVQFLACIERNEAAEEYHADLDSINNALSRLPSNQYMMQSEAIEDNVDTNGVEYKIKCLWRE